MFHFKDTGRAAVSQRPAAVIVPVLPGGDPGAVLHIHQQSTIIPPTTTGTELFLGLVKVDVCRGE